MKILRIIARLNVGGPARHVVWLTSALNSGDFRTELIAGRVPDGEEDMRYFASENGVAPVFVNELSRELSPKDVVSFWKVLKIARVFQPDIIHTHTAKAGTIGRAAAFVYRWITWRTLIGRPRRVKVVHTFHGHVFHGYYGRLKSSIFIAIERLLARAATDRIVAISRQQYDEIHDRFRVGAKEQFRIVQLGIDLSGSRDAEQKRVLLRDEIAASDDDIVVGFVGRMTEIKGLGLLIDAAETILSNSEKPGWRFVMIGDGELRTELEHRVHTLGLGDRITFLGNREDVADLMPGLDILALTSLNEGTPLSLIEGMANGIPFVSTAVGGVVDLAGEVEAEDNVDLHICQRGILVPDRTGASFARGLLYLGENRDLRLKQGSAGRKFVSEEFSLERLVADLSALYSELM